MRRSRGNLLLILSAVPNGIPAEVLDLARKNGIETAQVRTVYEIAAILSQEMKLRALFIEPTMLMGKVAAAVATFRRYGSFPIVLLPGRAPLGPSEVEELPAGVQSWTNAWPRLAQFIETQTEFAETGGFGEAEIMEEGPESGNVVTTAVEGRYDDLGVQPLLSEQEMRALLGPME